MAQITEQEIIVNDKVYFLTGEIYPTGRSLSNNRNYRDVNYGEEYDFEVAAEAVDEQGLTYILYWIVTETKGAGFDWDSLDLNREPQRIALNC